MTQNVLVIGSNGTIAQEVVSQLCADANNQVFTI
jgi:saccharopine dehydrogenase-like NADP-dependent oxidoreductase